MEKMINQAVEVASATITLCSASGVAEQATGATIAETKVSICIRMVWEDNFLVTNRRARPTWQTATATSPRTKHAAHQIG